MVPSSNRKLIRRILKRAIKTNKALIRAGAYSPEQAKERELEIARARLLRFLLASHRCKLVL